MESITGPISRIISREGMPGVYNALDDAGKKEFEKVCSPPCLSSAATLLSRDKDGALQQVLE